VEIDVVHEGLVPDPRHAVSNGADGYAWREP